MVALNCVKTEGDWYTVVGNKCEEIDQVTSRNYCHREPGHMNSADLPSCGCDDKILFERRYYCLSKRR